MGFKQLIEGNITFQDSTFIDHKNDFKTLAKKGQHPEVLFIGCSDSRVVPNLIMDSKPGDMFIVRNVGNFIAPYTPSNDFHGTAAAIEYAVSVLKVKHIIVCGHSHCGACKALYSEIGHTKEMAHIKKWLDLGNSVKEYVLMAYPNAKKEKIYRKTEKYSVLFQLKNLLTYPKVEKRVKSGKLKIHGWYYKIEDGSIEFYNKEEDRFINLKDSSKSISSHSKIEYNI